MLSMMILRIELHIQPVYTIISPNGLVLIFKDGSPCRAAVGMSSPCERLFRLTKYGVCLEEIGGMYIYDQLKNTIASCHGGEVVGIGTGEADILPSPCACLLVGDVECVAHFIGGCFRYHISNDTVASLLSTDGIYVGAVRGKHMSINMYASTRTELVIVGLARNRIHGQAQLVDTIFAHIRLIGFGVDTGVVVRTSTP